MKHNDLIKTHDDKNLLVEKIHYLRCDEPGCRNRAEYTVISAGHSTRHICRNHFQFIKKETQRPVKFIRGFEGEIKLKNNHQGSDKKLFKSSSVIVPPIPRESFKEFGKKGNKPKLSDFWQGVQDMAWEFTEEKDKVDYNTSLGSHMILIIWDGDYLLFDQNGRLVAKMDGHGHIVQMF